MTANNKGGYWNRYLVTVRFTHTNKERVIDFGGSDLQSAIDFGKSFEQIDKNFPGHAVFLSAIPNPDFLDN